MLLMCYRLNSEDSVQMVTALILQLIQSIIELPDDDSNASVANPEVQKVRYNQVLKSCICLSLYVCCQ